ncbi:MAG: hypothetical protein M3Z65_00405 [Chloroflexota bacterium]|nr:hypothetical protein [Chloroflexota bacterium]
MWLEHPGFSQRATGRFDEGGRVIWWWRSELQRDGPWKPDLETTYRRRAG